ncbi:sensor histidine kinase [Glycomyces tenuis]|uniref:sensor histidine kinase n=1 Tax=Glycomyces tenuis TaxID=58116 RepID=UPI00041F8324|nr:sensor histidine kinase [Glycomyces tenuis]
MEQKSRTADEIAERHSSLDRLYGRTIEWMPYATLAFSAALSLLVSEPPLRSHLVTLGLVAVTAAWVYAMFTRIPSKEDASPTRMAVYFFVMIALGAVLVSRDMLYFVFIVTGFFHAGLLRPAWMLPLGLGAAAVVVNSPIIGEVSVENVTIYLIVVAVQTVAISWGFQLTEKMERLNAERHEALKARELALEENAGLHMQLLAQAREAGVLDERQRMARDIHDTVAQGLAGIIAQLHAADSSGDETERRRHLDSAADLARDSLAEARRTVRAIGPPTLETSQLSEALEELSARWSQSHEVPVEVSTSGEAKPMHPEVEVTLLRIAQEALTNVAKHAEAGRVGITLTYMEDQLALDVRDDGLGFEPGRAKAGAKHGYGLSAMRQRVGRIAGSLSIESESGRGTVISASVPAVPAAVADA